MLKTSDKIAMLRNEMIKRNIQAVIIPSSDPHLSEYSPAHWRARAYFSGFSGSAGTLVITGRKCGLWTDGRYFIQAERELSGSGISLFRMGVRNVPTYSEFIAQELNEGDTVGFDWNLFSAEKVRKMQKEFANKHLQIVHADLVDSLWPDRPSVPHTQVFLHNEKYCGYSCAEKISQVRKELKKHKADGQIYARLDCVAWLMNIRADDVDDSPFALAYAAVLSDCAYLFIEMSRVPNEVLTDLNQNGVAVRGYEELETFIDSVDSKKTVLAESAGTSYKLYQKLESNRNITVLECPDLVTQLKSIKNDTEIRSIRQAHIRDGCAMVKAFAELEQRMNAGETVTECTVCEILKKAREQQPDNRGESFSTIAAYRDNAAMMHYSPKPDACSKLKKAGLLLVDTGGQYYGGTTDVTRTFALGPVTQEEKGCYTYVLKAHIALATAVFLEGSTGGNIDILCRETLWKQGIDYRCGTGHGVGMFGSVHEGPQCLRPKDNTVFRKGMTITNEPGVYMDGKFGIRTENLMLVDDTFENEYGRFLKFDTVTLFPIDTFPVLPELLTDEELDWLNGYHQRVRETLAPLLSGSDLDWLERHTKPLKRAD